MDLVQSSIDPASLAQQLQALQPRFDMSDGDLLATYWRFHPRFRFLKTLPGHAAVLDVGAGAGGLPGWKTWLEPVRTDLRLYAVDRTPAPHGHGYEAWACSDLDDALPDFAAASFDAALLSHVVEHLRDPARLLGWIGRCVRPGGRVYVEWPSEVSTTLPPREALLPLGIDIIISNFFDDCTHRRLIPAAEVHAALSATGLRPTASGTIDLGLV
ncbi:MAG: methyltransferase domain-containing protein, partial [Proteobacteria bacterium]|nr:methyltransferase domain-containing protein [Pseudomonadota bacterium]